MDPLHFRELRIQAGHTQSSLARLWRINRVTVANWERGVALIPYWAARLIAFEATFIATL